VAKQMTLFGISGGLCVLLMVATLSAQACEGREARMLYEGGVVGTSFHAADIEKKYKAIVVPSSGKPQRGVRLDVFLHGYPGAKQVIMKDCRGSQASVLKDKALAEGSGFEDYYLVKNRHGDIKLVRAFGAEKKAEGVLKGVCEFDVKSSLISQVSP
jgi:hypothetical protein